MTASSSRWRRPLGRLGPKSEIPDRLYFKIGDAAELVGVESHVLRYWEKEVPLIKPVKSRSNQRRYRRRDVEIFRGIERLLHEELYTLAGARRRLLVGGRASDEPAQAEPARAEPARDPGQMPLGFASSNSSEGLERLHSGLRDLIRMAGEEP
ncbi:MAG: MerR family transcriptional regulator [Deltaproteobacteria bacterium]|nr:MerR family transcriptional regulator [Deltaproteobacteria bacterium]